MKRWISLFLPLVVSKLTAMIQPVGETINEAVINKIIDRAFSNSRRMLILIVSAATATALLIAGIIIGGLRISEQIDQMGAVHFSAGIFLSIILISCSLLGLLFIFNKKYWTAIRPSGEADQITKSSTMNEFQSNQRKESSPIEVAISNLILDFIQQRQEDRQNRYSEHQARKNKPSGQEPKG